MLRFAVLSFKHSQKDVHAINLLDLRDSLVGLINGEDQQALFVHHPLPSTSVCQCKKIDSQCSAHLVPETQGWLVPAHCRAALKSTPRRKGCWHLIGIATALPIAGRKWRQRITFFQYPRIWCLRSLASWRVGEPAQISSFAAFRCASQLRPC